MKRIIAIVSDLHVGSRWGLFPKDFQLSTGSTYQLNKGQEYLLACWKHFQGKLPRRFDILIINGDTVEGQGRRLEGRDIIEPDPAWQVRAAVELLTPLAKRAKEVYVTQGTDYHVRPGGQDDEAVAQALGAIPDEAGHHAWDWLLLDVDGVLLDISHHSSTTMRYMTMPGEREIQFARMVADLKGGDADIIIRSHVHHLVVMNVDGDLALTTPAWQLQTRFCRRSRWPNRWLSRLLGGVMLDIEPKRKTGERQDKSEFIHIRPITYPHPVIERRHYAQAKA